MVFMVNREVCCPECHCTLLCKKRENGEYVVWCSYIPYTFGLRDQVTLTFTHTPHVERVKIES